MNYKKFASSGRETARKRYADGGKIARERPVPSFHTDLPKVDFYSEGLSPGFRQSGIGVDAPSFGGRIRGEYSRDDIEGTKPSVGFKLKYSKEFSRGGKSKKNK